MRLIRSFQRGHQMLTRAGHCIGLFILCSCAAVGVVGTSDPAVKLADASDLIYRQNRPLPAERLIWEAIAIYQERGDEHGLAHGYREYGELLRSPGLVKWETPYRRGGFHDASVTFDNRLEKSSEYLRAAISHYQNAEGQLRESGRFDALTNVYYTEGVTYQMLNRLREGCVAFDKSVEANAENRRRNPAAKPYIPPGYESYQKFITDEKRRAGCE